MLCMYFFIEFNKGLYGKPIRVLSSCSIDGLKVASPKISENPNELKLFASIVTGKKVKLIAKVMFAGLKFHCAKQRFIVR